MQDAIWMLALVLAGWAGWLDWRSRRIPNWLTVSALLVGLTANTVAGGWDGTKVALGGAGLALGLLFPFVLLRGIGAGDWKLMGALGAFLGPREILLILLVSILIAGIMAVLQTVRAKRLGTTLGNAWELIRGSAIFGLRPHPVITLDNPGLLSLPFGVAVALATMISYGAGWILGSS